ncbi:diguanylate cyclase/phosphodiesterase with PAS/PAC and integral membrane sensor(s) [Alkalidesulfovibrio alkalitolerans DSM 16529]|uniref:Diguanylate cyclase/phosphodiesterase with PAS/PAC and integral membrane sensor(S) n=1 Tax=Alkalidesulfovibrio alkalitolerans DSM 16529 TaxID=1121439 RepID=S7UN34_9BACT|nr:EAL domain-containing protein [Alkalidesulfovibrio alkalitolerans]EPR35399.1 diguanylate cyclase/phosphodiesterase with PAS/PAC and integral membrane sensor(s) [Alkalidesulfovibrio alkalitolerans DSM 16529]
MARLTTRIGGRGESLRTVTIAFVTGVFSILILASIVLTSSIVQGRFASIEQGEILRDARRAVNAIEADLEALDRVVRDWAWWDDTFAYLRGRKPDYSETNLVPSTFETQKLHLILLLRSDLRPAWQGYRAAGSADIIPLPEGMVGLLARRAGDRNAFPGESGFKGVFRHGGGLYILACRPVLDSAQEGPSPGWLVMARRIDPKYVAEIAERTDLALTLAPKGTSDEEAVVKDRAVTRRGTELAAAAMMRDVFGLPALRIEVTSPMAISEAGAQASRLLMLSLSLAGLLAALLLGLFLERRVLARVTSLGDQVRSVRTLPVGQRGVSLPGDDELARLARDMSTVFDELRESEERYRTIFMNTGAASILIEEDTSIILANREFAKFAGVSEERLAERPSWTQFFHEDDVPRMLEYHRLRRVTPEAAPRVYEARFKDALGRVRHVSMTVALIPGTGKSIASILDIGRMKEAEERLARQAFTDDLTGQPNRAHFLIRLEHAVAMAERAGTRLGVMLLDLDEFKGINDSLGHQAGDEVLIQVAERLRAALRRSDTLARLGGDEFTIIVEGVDEPEDLAEVARKIIATMGEPFAAAQAEIFLGVSIGIAVYPQDGRTPERLMQCADMAMYRSKTLGKNTFSFFTPDLNYQAVVRLRTENQLRAAVSDDRITAYFQPVVGIDDGCPAGFEALARWRDENGVVPPDAGFIAVAEKTGLIVRIDRLILEQACGFCARLNATGGRRLFVAVNISARHFLRGTLVDDVSGALAASGLDPDCLEIEITETTLMENFEAARRVIDELSSLGVRLALDDFGTGYSSLAYLRNLPVQKLKIDRAFIARSHTPDGGALLKAVVDLAMSLGIEPVAEGVETREQADYLRSIGCRLAQGWLFCRAVPAEQAEQMALAVPDGSS